MKGNITVGGKLGYLNLSTGKYMYSQIIGFNGSELLMRTENKRTKFANHYTEKIEDVLMYLNKPSIDFKDGRFLMKYKGTTKNY